MVVAMNLKPRFSRGRNIPIIWMGSDHSSPSSTPSSFCKAQNDFLPSQQTIQMQKYHNVLGLLLKIEVRDKNTAKAQREPQLVGAAGLV